MKINRELEGPSSLSVPHLVSIHPIKMKGGNFFIAYAVQLIGSFWGNVGTC